ncbi:tRNA lysidine(34) synthetase TilS [Segnochrobactraceae bacterium EtOH-i3]
MSAVSVFDDAELPALFAGLEASAGLALAVSGGPDSLGLLALIVRWRALLVAPPPTVVLTVDHGLRPEAGAEAAFVGALSARCGLAHETLVWEGEKPRADLQSAARAARYRLLGSRAAELGCDRLLVAHTLDDQAETLLMRLGRGSGLYGLAAMRPRSVAEGVTLERPLLGVPRARLVATLEAQGWAWIEDPSNQDRHYGRVRMRQLMESLAEEGLTAERLTATARRLRRAADVLDRLVASLAATALTLHHEAVAELNVPALATAEPEIALRLVSRLLRHVGATDYGPRLDALEAAFAAALAQDGRRTLNGVVLDRRADRLWLYREAGRTGLPVVSLQPGDSVLWDDRFRVSLAANAACAMTLGALGHWPQRARDIAPARLAASGLPAEARDTLPALAREDSVVAVLGLTPLPPALSIHRPDRFDPARDD